MRFLLLFLFTFALFLSHGQSSDAALNQRLNEYLDANRKLDFETVMNYIYPKLFKVASRESMVDAMKKAFDNDQMKIKMDSMAIGNVSPVFAAGKSSYRKVDYSMTMDVRFLNKEKLKDTSFIKLLEKNFAKVFRGTAAYNPASETFHVRGNQFMVAVKEQGQPWMFIGHKPNKELNEFLFPKTVITRFNLLKE